MSAHAVFPREEFETRWRKVHEAMRGKGYQNLLVWQRGAGGFDRAGDVYWLTRFVMNGSGQDPASEEFGAPYTFSAVLLRAGHEPELHIGLAAQDVDLSGVVCGRIVSHPDNLMAGLGRHFRAEGIAGRVALVGDDVLPGMYDRQLRRHTPQIEWHSDEMFLWEPQNVKSERELAVFRAGGELVTRAMTSAAKRLLAGDASADAAADAAAVLLRAGGGYHRIDIHHGAGTERTVVSNDFYGYRTAPPSPGDLCRLWIYGPILGGYWLDPGRTLIVGNRPSPAQRALLEGCAEVVDIVARAMRPGITPRQLAALGAEAARRHGYFDHPQLQVPMGHGLGSNFIPYAIPIGDAEPDPTDQFKLDRPLSAGMVMASELFLTHPGVGTAGFEHNLIVTEDGCELLTKTPMLW